MLKVRVSKKNNRLKKNIFLEIYKNDSSMNVEAPVLKNIYEKTGRLPVVGNTLCYLNNENVFEYVFVFKRIFIKKMDEEQIFLLCNAI